jgi:hypothetical protein
VWKGLLTRLGALPCSFVKTETSKAPSTQKVRRDVVGGKRGDGQNRTRARVRPNPHTIRRGKPDPQLTGVAGLVDFGRYLRTLGVDRELGAKFQSLKSPESIYPMSAQLRLLMDLFVGGEVRVFGLEAMASDALFVQLAGGVLPSLDTVYRDLDRWDEASMGALERMMWMHGVAELAASKKKPREIHIDIDTSVMEVFGQAEGAEVGYNPRYHGRPSYHPVLARVAETDSVVGAILRPGNTSFGVKEVPFVTACIERVRNAVGADCVIHVRIDCAGDCAEIMRAVHDKGALFATKARLDAELCAAVSLSNGWKTIDRDAFDRPLRQVTELSFARKEWLTQHLKVRVTAVRSIDYEKGKQTVLWNHLDYNNVQVFLTNDFDSDSPDIIPRYNKRAGIEPLIAELKSGWGIDKIPTRSFVANHVVMVLKMLAHNLLRRFVRATVPALRAWRAPWLRRALIRIPGRLVRGAGRCWQLRMAPRPVYPLLN